MEQVETKSKKTSRFKKAPALYAAAGAWALLLLTFAASGLVPRVLPDSNITVAFNPPQASENSQAVPAFNPMPKPSELVPVITAERLTALALPALNSEYSEFGSITIAGMKGSDYDKAMAAEWTNIDTSGDPAPYDIDLSELMDYKIIENYILNLGRYDGVSVSVIGSSESGRNIYMVEVSLPGGTEDRPVIMLSGSVHAREFAGAEYMIKFLNDTLKKALTDKYTRALLQSVTIVAVPLVNPDGREIIIEGGDPLRKSNADGVDLNRAMPSVNAGQLAAGEELPENFSTEPGLDFFAGYSLGSESETQAMMKWMDTFVPKAAAYIDLHQQGGITLYNKRFASAASDEACKLLAQQSDKLLKKGYEVKEETDNYGVNGDGGTLTDYARSISEGFVYSYRLGRFALNENGSQTPLICFGDIDNNMRYYKPLNEGFKCITIEIGRKPTYLGPSEEACENRKTEYKKYGWSNFLTGTIENVLGKDKLKEIKAHLKY